MQTQCSADLFGFAPVEGRAVVAGFDGGRRTSDAGALLLGATDRAPIRQSDLRHDPPQAPQDRRAGAHQRAADQIRPTNQPRGALTKQNKRATVFRPVNRNTITVPARTRIGCGPSYKPPTPSCPVAH